jgi:hypothetical protein
MTAPNILSLTTINGKTAVLAITTSATNIVSNAGASGKVLKINALWISNVDGTNSADVTIDLYRSSTAYRIASTVPVAADATVQFFDKPVYLEEGDALRLTASADNDLEGLCSYEDLS